MLVYGKGLPLDCVAVGANRNDSSLLRPTLQPAAPHQGSLAEADHVHLNAGYDSRRTRDLREDLGCDYVISTKGEPLQAGARWVVDRSSSWHNRGFKKLAICTEVKTKVIDALISLANTIIVSRRLIAETWVKYR